MDDSPFMPDGEALVSIGEALLDHAQTLIGSELNIAWEVPFVQQSHYDGEPRVYFRDHVIDRAGYNDGSTIKCCDHFHQENPDLYCHRQSLLTRSAAQSSGL